MPTIPRAGPNAKLQADKGWSSNIGQECRVDDPQGGGFSGLLEGDRGTLDWQHPSPGHVI